MPCDITSGTRSLLAAFRRAERDAELDIAARCPRRFERLPIVAAELRPRKPLTPASIRPQKFPRRRCSTARPRSQLSRSITTSCPSWLVDQVAPEGATPNRKKVSPVGAYCTAGQGRIALIDGPGCPDIGDVEIVIAGYVGKEPENPRQTLVADITAENARHALPVPVRAKG